MNCRDFRVSEGIGSETLRQGRRIKIAHIALQLDVGGMEKTIVEFARRADRERYELMFVSMTTAGPVFDEIKELGWPVEALGIASGFRPGIIIRLSRLFREWNTDIVHAHNTKPMLYGAPAARLARVPVVIYTRHGQRHGATPKQNILFRLAAKCIDSVVSVSSDSARRSADDGIASSRLHTIRNGIDLDRFQFRGPFPDGPAVTVGRLSPEKDIATLLQAAAIAIREQPDFHLEIAGNGSCLDELRRLAAHLGIVKSVTFLGNVNDIPALLARASMSVLSSVTEGISLTLLEASARGLPVVATNVGGNPEVVVHETTGILVPPKDPTSLADAMLRLWRDPALRLRMGLAGRHHVKTQFDVRRMIDEYERLYERHLAG